MRISITPTQAARVALRLAVLLLAYAGGYAEAIVVLEDEFTYSDGPLVATPQNGGWIATHAGGSNPVQVVSERIIVSQEDRADSEEDIASPLSQTLSAGETFYYGFDVAVSQLPDMGVVNQVYFANFSNSSTGAFITRTFVWKTAPGIDGDFTFGLRTNDGSAPVLFDTVGFAFDQTYRVVAGYEFDTGRSTLWIDPITIASPSITEANMSIDPLVDNSMIALNRMNFRQDGLSGDTIQEIDNLVVATTFAEVIGDAPPAGNADYNGDGTVNLADYAIWRDNLGAAAGSPGDSNNNGVGVDDYDAWKVQFGNIVTGSLNQESTSQVPEPTTAVCLLLGLTMGWRLLRSCKPLG